MSESPRGEEAAETADAAGAPTPEEKQTEGNIMKSDEHQAKILQALERHMRERGQPALVLRIGEKDVTAGQLWLPVMYAGGCEAVTAQKGWAAIGRMFNPPKGMTDLSHKIKRAFESHLLPFEQAIRRGEIEGIAMPDPDARTPKGQKAQKRHSGGDELDGKSSIKRSKGGSNKVRNGVQDHVGRRILIKMSSQDGSEDAFYIGTIASFRKDSHHIEFDDGDSEELNLAEEVWRFATDKDEEEAVLHNGRVALGDEGMAPRARSPSTRAGLQGRPTVLPTLAPPSLPLPASQTRDNPEQIQQQQTQYPAGAGPSEEAADAGGTQGPDPADCSPTVSESNIVASGEGFKVHKCKDNGAPGYEIYVMASGMTKDDVKVKCWAEGRVRVQATPQKEIQNWTEEPIERNIHLPTPIDPHSAKALITLHGLLFIKVAAKQDNA